MKKRFFKTAPALLICAALLCGCSETASEAANVTPPQSSTSQIIQTQPASTAVSASNSESDRVSVPTSVDESDGSASGASTADSQTSTVVSSSEPISSDTDLSSISSISTPQSISSISTPQSISSISTPQSTSSVSAPQSTSSKSTPQSTSSKSTPQSTSSKSTPQSTSSKSTPQSTSSTSTTPPSANTSLLDNYTQKWAYNQLDAKQRAVYARLFESATNFTEDCNISDIGYSLDDLDRINTAFWAFDYDNPQFLVLGSGYVYTYSINGYTGEKKMKAISIDYARTPAQIRSGEFNKTAQSVIAAANALPSDYEKLKYIHDWIINNTVYINTDADYEREADGPLIYGKAVCEGYSKAFMYLAQSLGFECVCVSGIANEAHMWNKVKLGGKWYNVDVTWDDPVRSDGVQMLRYNYFLISDETISRDHSAKNEFALPSAAESYVQ